MFSESGTILYVGKAKNLKKRLASYFVNLSHRDIKTSVLVSQISSIQLIVTRTEDEALILERQLIQAFQPRYNIALKDDKNYPYLKVTVQDFFPMVLVVRQRIADGAKYFGPYPSMGSSRFMQRLLGDLFPLRDCSQKIDLLHKQPKCMQLDLGRCLGPCVYKQVKPDYDAWVHDLILLLSGKSRQLIADMRSRMGHFAEALKFEQAAVMRDRVLKLEQLLDRQLVELDRNQHVQVWVYAHDTHTHYALVQTIIDGKFLYQNGFYLEKKEASLDLFLDESIMHFLDQKRDDVGKIVWSQWLVDDAFYAVFHKQEWASWLPTSKIIVPKRGIKRTVLESAQKNAHLALMKLGIDALKGTSPVEPTDIQDALALAVQPKRMVCIDISHFQGVDIVGSAVVFQDAKPLRTAYRRFQIRTVAGKSDDPRSIQEVVTRYIELVIRQSQPLPDLLVIDGGKPQLAFAIKALEGLQLASKIPCVALAKQDEELFFPDRPTSLKLEKHHPVLHLLQRLRDEAHRFAITYQKYKRRRRFLGKK